MKKKAIAAAVVSLALSTASAQAQITATFDTSGGTQTFSTDFDGFTDGGVVIPGLTANLELELTVLLRRRRVTSKATIA
jgi:hypothetical protein